MLFRKSGSFTTDSALRHLNRACGSIFFENYLSLRFQEWAKGKKVEFFLTGLQDDRDLNPVYQRPFPVLYIES
jgi:hypothetical protein